MPSLLDRRLIVVIGKGGVGKSTVAAGLALAGARKGKRVLVAEVNARERVSVLLERRPVGHEIGQLEANIDAVNVEPRAAMREYALMILKFRSIYNAVFENRMVRYFLRAVPSLAQLVMLGKILYHVNETLPDGRPRWDLVVLDAPATGHGLLLLRLPQVLATSMPSGPMADEAHKMHQTLIDPRRTAVALVSLPEAMPVNEAIELNRQLRDVVGTPPAALFLNGYVRPRFSPEERERLRGAPGPLADAAQAVLSRELRAELSERYANKLAVDTELPPILLPFLFTRRFGRAEIEQISQIVESA
ncbi:MAG: AAA family ATPase [Deltaproteobacteria bacterium]|nr:AAA family ATPase [Deltaproteobacteria bacterium]